MSFRELPCPYRIIDDFGGGFSMGCFAGAVWHFLRGMWYAPKSERFYTGISLLKKRAPVLGGSFAMWGGIFSITDCTLMHLRNKEDYLNPICAGFVSGGVLAFRAGARIAFRNAILGGLILTIIQGVEIGFIKWQRREEMKQMQKMHEEQTNQQLQMIKERRPDIYEQIMRAKEKHEQEQLLIEKEFEPNSRPQVQLI